MRRQTVVRGVVLGVALAAGVAGAQTQPASSTPATPWTVDSGQTVGDGSNVIRGQVGWPGLWLDFIHGLDSTTDIGGRFSLDWGGWDGSTQGSYGIGLGAQLLLRKQMFEIGGFKGALTFNPGFLIYFPSGGTTAGITFPIGAQMGFPVADKITVNASFELPFWVTFSPGVFYIPILFGGGVEYAMQPDLLLTFKLAMGPSIATCSGCGAAFALNGLVGVAYKLK